MLILDTNVLSALMTARPAPEVQFWIETQLSDDLYTTAVSQAEIMSGLSVMAAGKRQLAMQIEASRLFADYFGGRVLPFDSEAVPAYADIFAARRLARRPISRLDLMIAAIASSHRAAVVTRDTGDFEGCGLALINPWKPAGASR